MGKIADRIYSKKVAANFPTVSVNAVLRKYMVFDVDYENAGCAWMDAGLPYPTMIIKNKENGHAHYVYELNEAVRFDKDASVKAMNFYKNIYHAIMNRLKADSGYMQYLMKNPLNSKWETITYDVQYDLQDFADIFDTQETFRPWKKEAELSDVGRNCYLFDLVRYWSYKNVGLYERYEAWQEACLVKCFDNNIEKDESGRVLPLSEVRSISKSIAKWTWQRRFEFGQSVMKLNEGMDLREKQRLGAVYSASVKKEATISTLRASYALIQGLGAKPTQKAVSEHAGKSLRTVKSYWKLVKAVELEKGAISSPYQLDGFRESAESSELKESFLESIINETKALAFASSSPGRGKRCAEPTSHNELFVNYPNIGGKIMVKKIFLDIRRRIEQKEIDFEKLKPDAKVIQDELQLLKHGMSPSDFESLKMLIENYLNDSFPVPSSSTELSEQSERATLDTKRERGREKPPTHN